jgi:hypothetical protein
MRENMVEGAEKNHVVMSKQRGFDLRFVWAFIGLSGRSFIGLSYRSAMGIQTSSQALSASTWFFSAASRASWLKI